MTWTIRNPYDGSLIGEFPLDANLESKVAAARLSQRDWARTDFSERRREIEAGLDHFRNDRDRIAADITRQMGKPLAQAQGEIDGFFERAEHLLSIAEDALAPEVLPAKTGFDRRIEHVPLGVVLCIAAWNYPLLIPVNVVIPALLAGNTVLLKHSEYTPLCGQEFERAFGPSLVTNLIVSHEQIATLIERRQVDHVSFTGSVEGGRTVYSRAAAALLDTGLELGGKDAAYVAADADLDFAVENIVDGACYNAGQSCCAVERVYVHDSHYEAFLERSQPLLEAYCLGDPMIETTTMGPLARASAASFLEEQCRDAQSRGARILCGGYRPAELDGAFFQPTLLADVADDTRVMREESFGPLLPVARVANDEEALALMNDSNFGLTASVWTKNNPRAETLASRLDVGTVFQNRCDYLDPALPWTGVRDSGIGSTLSRYGFLGLTRRKSLHFRNNP